jgi:cytochrome c oxidase subunit 2
MTHRHARASVIAAAVALGGAAPAARADWALNMTPGISAISREVYSIHMLVFWWCVGIAVFVFGWMIYSLVRFRKSKGAVPDTKLLHNARVEMVWTVIPIVILVMMAVPAARTLIAMEDASGSELTIRVTGYQWKWEYEYVNHGVRYFSTLDRASNETRELGSGRDPYQVPHYLLDVDNPLVVPADTKVRVLISAQDVIHAWWVPALAIKKDAIPGTINVAWFKVDADKTGVYRGQCAELCGRDHGFMPVVVDVRSKQDFAAWLKAQQAAAAPAATAALDVAPRPAG